MIFDLLLTALMLLTKIVLMPIDFLIAFALPELSQAFDAIGNYIGLISSGLAWAISSTGVPMQAVVLIGFYFIFKLTLPLQIYTIKLAINWYNTLKP